MIQMPSEVSACQPYPRNAAARVNIPMLTFKRGRDGLTKEDRAADALVVPDGGLHPSSGTTPLFVVVRTCGLRPLPAGFHPMVAARRVPPRPERNSPNSAVRHEDRRRRGGELGTPVIRARTTLRPAC